MTKEEIQEYNREYNRKNKDSISKNKKAYYEKNKESKKEYGRKRYAKDKKKFIQKSWEYEVLNKEKVRETKKDYRKNNKDKLKDHALRKNFGITLEQYNKMFNEQGGCCKICNNPETAIFKKTGATIMLAVDHCHKTGKVRGLLCGRCNPALGAFNDDIEILESAIDYLRSHGK